MEFLCFSILSCYKRWKWEANTNQKVFKNSYLKGRVVLEFSSLWKNNTAYSNSRIATFVLVSTFLYFKTELNFKPIGKIIASTKELGPEKEMLKQIHFFNKSLRSTFLTLEKELDDCRQVIKTIEKSSKGHTLLMPSTWS